MSLSSPKQNIQKEKSPFKCCANKRFPDFVCISCYGVFHPSCLNRKSYFKHLGDHKIICSRKCESDKDAQINSLELELKKLQSQIDDKNSTIDSMESEIASFKEGHLMEIEKLRQDLKARNSHFLRLQRKSQTFEDEVLECEQKYEEKCSEQRQRIVELNRQLSEASQQEHLLKVRLHEEEENNKKLKNEITELSRLNLDMVTSIKTLEANIDWSNNEICRLRADIKAATATTGNLTDAAAPIRFVRDRVLIVGDGNAKGAISNFKKYATGNFDYNCQWKNGITIEELIDECIPLCKDFTRRDYVFLFVGPRNCITGRAVSREKLSMLHEKTEGTNLIVIGPMFWINRPVLNKLITEQNNLFRVCFQGSSHACFIPIISDSSFTGAMSFYQKDQLTRYLCNSFICRTPHSDLPLASTTSSGILSESSDESSHKKENSTENFHKTSHAKE